MQAQHPDQTVEVWSQDEARLGLKPIQRRVWTLPVALQQTRYQWLYVYLFGHPASGRSYFLILPTVSTERMSLALEAFVRDMNLQGEKELVLILDNAGWHRAKGLRVPQGLRLVYLPAYTPELSPTEPMVPLLREAVANRRFADLDAAT